MPITDEDKWYGPAAQYFRLSNTSIIASDGSVAEDGSMGAAEISFSTTADTPLQITTSCFKGPVSSTAAELRGLSLAQALVQSDEDTIILTDS